MRSRGQKLKTTEYDILYGKALEIFRNHNNDKKTQKDIANLLSVTSQQYVQYENGKNKISINIENELTKIFGFDNRSDFVKKIEEIQNFLNKK